MGARTRDGGKRWLSALLVAAAFCVGCGEDSNRVYFGAAAEAKWTWSPATADALGYTIAVAVLQLRRDDSTCDALPSSTRVFINGMRADLTPQADTRCMAGGQVLGPSLHDQTVTVTDEEAGDVTATATFTNLLPGTAATMSGPSDVLVPFSSQGFHEPVASFDRGLARHRSDAVGLRVGRRS